jgi:CHASE3 domain sensor protein
MFTLQEVERAEESVHTWHDEMRQCLSEQRERDEVNGQRRSWRAMLAHCVQQLTRRRVEQPAHSSTALPAETWGR